MNNNKLIPINFLNNNNNHHNQVINIKYLKNNKDIVHRKQFLRNINIRISLIMQINFWLN
jgi:hypothetical protein